MDKKERRRTVESNVHIEIVDIYKDKESEDVLVINLSHDDGASRISIRNKDVDLVKLITDFESGNKPSKILYPQSYLKFKKF